MVNNQVPPKPWHGRRNDPQYVADARNRAVRRQLLELFDENDLETSADRRARQAVEWSAAGWLVVGLGAAICLCLAILAGE